MICYCLPFCCAEELGVLGIIFDAVAVIWAISGDAGRLLLCFSRVLERGWLGAFSWAPILEEIVLFSIYANVFSRVFNIC